MHSLSMAQGAAIERCAAGTNWNYYEATLRFQHVLQVSGAPARPPDGKGEKASARTF